MTTSEIINEWLGSTQTALIENYDKLGLRASGKWANSLEPFSEQVPAGFRVGIKGQEYTGAIENGRRPNRNSSDEQIKAWVGWAGNTIMKQWVEDKGLDISPFAVAWKVAMKGWDVPNPHNAGGLVRDVITKKRIEELTNDLSLKFIDDFRTDTIRKVKLNRTF